MCDPCSVSTCQIKKSGDSLTVLVVDRVSESCYARRKVPILPTVAECHSLPHVAKTMDMEKGKDGGYGFMLRHERRAMGRRLCEQLQHGAHTLTNTELG